MFISVDEKIKKAILLYENIIKEELNIKEIEFENDLNVFNDKFLIVNFKTAGAVLKGEVQTLKKLLEDSTEKEMEKLVKQYENGKISVGKFENLDSNIFLVQNKAKKEFVISTENNITVVLDIDLTEELILEGLFREVIRVAQTVRKEAGYNVEDRIIANFETNGKQLLSVLKKFGNKIKKEVLIKDFSANENFDFNKEVEIGEEKLKISVKKA